MQLRIRIFSLIYIFAFVVLTSRLFFWQIVRGRELSDRARQQYQTGISVSATRGGITANDGSSLVASSEAWLVYANPRKLTEDPRKIAEKLALFFIDEADNEEEKRKALLLEIDRLESLLTKKGLVWVALRQKVSPEVKSALENLDVTSLGFELQESRLYPESSSAAHLLGFVGKNSEGSDQGYFGLEGYYDLLLSGRPGFVSRESDPRGIPILISASREILALGGVSLLTHLDKFVQFTLDKNLLEGIEKYGAVGGSAVVMNPKNGAIVAMSSYPSYEPYNYQDFGDEYFKNPVISDSFEPGSVFKILVMAAALDAKAVERSSKCDICEGPLKIDKYTIETWDKKYHPDATMTDIIVNSDNVGMVFVGQKMGAEKLYDYLKDFGIGQLTDIDLQGELSAPLRNKTEWSVVDLATASFGQGVAVTPIQLIRAVSAIANSGIIVTPQIVDGIESEGWEEDLEESGARRVISERAAKEVTEMMVAAAKNGEAKWTHLKGFKVAGKTGTAQIPIQGHYDEEKTIASFVGFAPYNDPKFVMLVTLREPASSPWASETAAPLWYSIAKDLFLYYGIQPEN